MAETQTGKRKNTWVIVAVAGAILLLLLCGCLAIFAGGWLFVQRAPVTHELTTVDVEEGGRQVGVTRNLEDAFTVGTPAVLVIENQVGMVQVLGKDQEQISVEVTVHGYGATSQAAQEAADAVSVAMGTVGDHEVRLAAKTPDKVHFGRSPSVDWVIYVPTRTAVQVRNGVGRVDIRNTVGSAVVRVDVGEVRVRGLTMTGDTSLTTDVGEIDITLPADSAFKLDASTHVGKIRSEFKVAAEEQSQPGPSSALKGTVGDGPEISLTLRTGTGAITIAED